MLVYILLVAVIMGGTVGIVNQLLRNSANLKTGINKEEEANFILKKMSWIINDDSSVSTPARNSSSPNLVLSKNDFSQNPVTVDMNGQIIRIKRGVGSYKQLSNDSLAISDLKFDRSWDGVDPDSDVIIVSFKIDGKYFQLSRKIQ
jgi:hypothetical protein